jgi:hypothetical protein
MSHTDSELAMLYVSFVDKNSKSFQLQIRLTNYEFSKNLLDKQSSQYKNLKTKLDNSVRKQSNAFKFFYHFANYCLSHPKLLFITSQVIIYHIASLQSITSQL